MNQCPLCEDFSTPTFQLLIQHVGQVHSKSSDFHLTCGVDNCQTTYTNFAAFKRHLRKKHRSCLHETLLTSEIQTCGSVQEEDEDLSVDEGYLPVSDSAEERMKIGARWILRVKGRKLTQSCIEELLGDVTDLCSYTEPVQVTLGTYYQWKGEGPKRKIVKVKDSFTYVPILKMLEAMMKNPAVMEEVLRNHLRMDDSLADFCDSPKAKEHPLFGADDQALHC